MAAQLALVINETVADTTVPSYDATPRLTHQVAGIASLVTLRFSPLGALRRFAESLVLRVLPARPLPAGTTRRPIAVEARGSHLRLVR